MMDLQEKGVILQFPDWRRSNWIEASQNADHISSVNHIQKRQFGVTPSSTLSSTISPSPSTTTINTMNDTTSPNDTRPPTGITQPNNPPAISSPSPIILPPTTTIMTEPTIRPTSTNNNGMSNNLNSGNITSLYIVVPAVIVLVLVLTVVFLRYQPYLSWFCFRPKVTKASDIVEVAYATTASFGGTDSFAESQSNFLRSNNDSDGILSHHRSDMSMASSRYPSTLNPTGLHRDSRLQLMRSEPSMESLNEGIGGVFESNPPHVQESDAIAPNETNSAILNVNTTEDLRSSLEMTSIPRTSDDITVENRLHDLQQTGRPPSGRFPLHHSNSSGGHLARNNRDSFMGSSSSSSSSRRARLASVSQPLPRFVGDSEHPQSMSSVGSTSSLARMSQNMSMNSRGNSSLLHASPSVELLVVQVDRRRGKVTPPTAALLGANNGSSTALASSSTSGADRSNMLLRTRPSLILESAATVTVGSPPSYNESQMSDARR